MIANLLKITIIAMISLHANADTIYMVRRGDALIRVLRSKSLKPIYGESGSLAKAISLNRNIQRNSGNRIYPGQKIILTQLNSSLIENDIRPNILKEETKSELKEIKAGSEISFFEQKNIASFGFGLSYFRFDVEDKVYGKSLEVLSDLLWSLSLGYQVHWSPSYYTLIKASYQKYSFKNLNSGASFKNQTGGLWGANFETGYLYKKTLTPHLGFNFQDQIFFKANSNTVYEINSILIPEPYIGFDYNLFKFGDFFLSTGPKYHYLISTNSDELNVKSGYRLGIHLSLTEKFSATGDPGLRFKLGYESGKQDSDLANQRSKRVYINMETAWGL